DRRNKALPMRIDAFTHFIPQRYFEKMLEIAGDHKDIGKRVREIPCIHDVDLRRKIVGSFADYAQVLSLPLPPIEAFAKPEMAEEMARIANDGFAELVAKFPEQFPGFVAQAPLTAPDAGAREAERAINELGAAGVQIYTNVNGKPLDRPEFA